MLDTNVLIAAWFRPDGAARRLVEAVRDGHLALVWDTPTRGESETLLRRIPPIRWEAFEPLFRAEARFEGRTDPDAFPGVPDPSDRAFAALAAAAGAVLVSLDADLLDAGLGVEPEVLRPQAAVARWWAESEEAGTSSG